MSFARLPIRMLNASVRTSAVAPTLLGTLTLAGDMKLARTCQMVPAGTTHSANAHRHLKPQRPAEGLSFSLVSTSWPCMLSLSGSGGSDSISQVHRSTGCPPSTVETMGVCLKGSAGSQARVFHENEIFIKVSMECVVILFLKLLLTRGPSLCFLQ